MKKILFIAFVYYCIFIFDMIYKTKKSNISIYTKEEIYHVNTFKRTVILESNGVKMTFENKDSLENFLHKKTCNLKDCYDTKRE